MVTWLRLGTTHPFWIGLTDTAVEGTFEWINGEPVGYTRWSTGEPDDAPGLFGADFVVMYPQLALWGDEPSTPPNWPLPRGVVELVSSDCDGNGLPDVWELIADPGLDCDDNGVHDFCDLQDPSLDCDGLDSCQIESDPSLDCDGNGSIDSCEILADGSLDCDGVQGLDSCQIELDPSLDWDGNDVLDSCAGGGPNYCIAFPNSAGLVGVIHAEGSPLVSAADLTLVGEQLPVNKWGYFLMSATPLDPGIPNFGGSSGVLCLGAPQVRFNGPAGYSALNSGLTGSMSMSPDFAALPQNISFQPGDVWHFQLWYRDDIMTTPTSNTTDAIRVMFR